MSGFGGTMAAATMAGLAALATAVQAQELRPLVGATRVIGSDYNYVFQCLLGAADADGAFVASEDAAAGVAPGARIGWYDLGGAQGSGTGHAAVPMDVPCDYAATVDADGAPGVAGSYVGIGGDWPALPGVLRLHSPVSETYGAAAAEYFAAIGHATDSVTLRQVIRTDFEGDGVEEVVLTVTDYASPGFPSTRPGDHSVILLRRVVDGVVETVIVDGDIHDTRQEFAAPLEYSVIAIVDLNGDGVAEIVATSDYYEGNSFVAYRVDGPVPELALICGCGV